MSFLDLSLCLVAFMLHWHFVSLHVLLLELTWASFQKVEFICCSNRELLHLLSFSKIIYMLGLDVGLTFQVLWRIFGENKLSRSFQWV